VVPREILRKVRRIEIRTRRIVDETLAGGYHSVFKGRGMEFSEVREYQIGDDVRTIDWNVTSRMGHPYVKKYVEERELTVLLAVDISGSSRFGSTAQSRSEVVAEICALLAFAAARNNDRVGLLLFSDRIEKYVPPRKGRRHVLRVLREVLYYEPAGKRTNLALALETVRRLQRRRAVVFVLSDFLAAEFERPLRLASRFHDLVALVVRDPREASLPAVGLVGLEDAETGECVIVDTSQAGLRERFRQAAEARAARLQGLFQKLAVDAVELWTDRAYDAPLVRFFARRARLAR
jgi:uncharacterized protein (DUF58 family)